MLVFLLIALAFAAGDVAGDFRSRRPLQDRHLSGRDVRLESDLRLEGAQLDFPGMQGGVLHIGFEQLPGVFPAGAAEFHDHRIVEVLEQLAIDAEAGAAEVRAVVQLAIGDLGRETGLLHVVRRVEHDVGADVAGKSSVGCREGGLAVRDRQYARPAGRRRLQGDDIGVGGGLGGLHLGQLLVGAGDLLLQVCDLARRRLLGALGLAQKRHLGFQDADFLLERLKLEVARVRRRDMGLPMRLRGGKRRRRRSAQEQKHQRAAAKVPRQSRLRFVHGSPCPLTIDTEAELQR